jgi:hypothetical protein
MPESESPKFVESAGLGSAKEHNFAKFQDEVEALKSIRQPISSSQSDVYMTM